MPQAIPYIRFSSSIQQKGSSLERQQNLIDDYLKLHPEVELSSLQYQDLGLSGYKGKHLENDLGKLLEAIEAGHIKAGDYILVEAMDRLGRLPELEMISLLHSILKHDVKIITLQDGQEYSNEALAANGGLLYLLAGKVQMSHQHSKQLSERVSAAWVKKRKDAEAGKGVKRKAPWWITWNDETDRHDIITEEDKQLLNDVYKWYLSGLGERRILARLREVKPEKFGSTDPATVKRWLRNKTAIGYWNDIPDAYPAAIPDYLFYQVQEELARRADGKSQTPRSGHFLCGLVKCGCCGGNFSMRSNKHSRDAMLCSIANKRKDKCTNGKTIPVQVLDWVRNETFAEAIQQIETNSQSQEADQELAVVKGQIAELEERIDNLIELVAAGSKRTQKVVSLLEDELEKLHEKESDLLLQIRKPSEVSYADAMVTGSEMLDNPELLNELLRKTGYYLSVNGNKITYDDRVWEYVKWSRKNDCYHMSEWTIEGDLVSEFTLDVGRGWTPEEIELWKSRESIETNYHVLDLSRGEKVKVSPDDNAEIIDALRAIDKAVADSVKL
ncbi:recombinase family protein [Photobacterium sp. ZSDE20]|uniref:Recombinase family protein n=1 Tax=Photobacterium pectinilyticum TaxID=2906793 RepID=A0ABT1N7W7_9GAMM|nr:recombinase family protein [Photobacterium sp. ZSDE20]MCQ1060847.1 recombinase family protein [Photobacterium sp. ZSDE20]MDD1828640.1 recombinase family protein [Photobacterium sp. ZSDE20]